MHYYYIILEIKKKILFIYKYQQKLYFYIVSVDICIFLN